MPLDPNVAALLQFIEAQGYPALADGTPEDARTALSALMAPMQDEALADVAREVRDTTIAGDVRVRVYTPRTDGPTPTLVYFHGGGFVIGDLDTHDGICRLLTRDLEAVVVSVDYRLAPEAPFPAAVQDCYRALSWVAEHVDDYGGDPKRLAVGGDSAGGNLAAVCAQKAHADGIELAAQLLVYPDVDLAGDDYPSREENKEGYFLTLADMHWFAAQYLGIPYSPDLTIDPDLSARVADPELSPLLAKSLAGLAPAVVVTAEYDPLRDEGDRYAQALKEAGVRVEHRQFPGLIHGFYGLEKISPAIVEATAWTNGKLKELLG